MKNRQPTPLLSPRGLLMRAVILLAAFGIAQVAGLREHTTFLSGTAVIGRAELGVFLGVTYMVLYFGAVLASPILALAAGFVWLTGRLQKSDPPGPETETSTAAGAS